MSRLMTISKLCRRSNLIRLCSSKQGESAQVPEELPPEIVRETKHPRPSDQPKDWDIPKQCPPNEVTDRYEFARIDFPNEKQVGRVGPNWERMKANRKRESEDATEAPVSDSIGDSEAKNRDLARS